MSFFFGKEIAEDVEHTIPAGWLKWTSGDLQILQVSGQTSYDLWSKILANEKATYAQNGCGRDENVEMDVR